MLSVLLQRYGMRRQRPQRRLLRASVEAARYNMHGWLARLAAMLASERMIDARRLSRLWDALADWLILGGVLVVPVAAICFAVGAVLPGGAPFHRHTSGFFAFAMLWFITALMAAHIQRRRLDDHAAD